MRKEILPLLLNVHSKSSIEAPIIESGHVVTVQGRSVDLVGKLISTGGAHVQLTYTTEHLIKMKVR